MEEKGHLSGYIRQHTGAVELALDLVLCRVVGRVEAGGLLDWRSRLVERVESGPGLVRPGRVVGWLGPVDDC